MQTHIPTMVQQQQQQQHLLFKHDEFTAHLI